MSRGQKKGGDELRRLRALLTTVVMRQEYAVGAANIRGSRKKKVAEVESSRRARIKRAKAEYLRNMHQQFGYSPRKRKKGESRWEGRRTNFWDQVRKNEWKKVVEARRAARRDTKAALKETRSSEVQLKIELVHAILKSHAKTK